MTLIDLSHEIKDNMPVFPGDDAVKLIQDKFIDQDGYTNYLIKTGFHIGTHLDTPMHMMKSNKSVSDYPLESFCGRGIVFHVRGENPIQIKEEYKALIKEGDIVFFHTGHDKLYSTKAYYHDYPIFSDACIQFLIDKNIKMIGMDTPSPDRYPFSIHKKLFHQEIFIIENLCHLEKLGERQTFEVFAFPLKIKADASLVRVVAKI